MGTRRPAAERELINTSTDKRNVRQDPDGTFRESDDVGRSLAQDRQRKAVRRSFGEYAASLTRALRAASDSTAVIAEHLEHFTVAVLAADDQGRYLAANELAAALTGFSPTELLSLSVRDLIVTAEPAELPTMWEVFIEEGYQHGVVTIRHKNGETIRAGYDAYGHVAHGVNVSFLTALTDA